MDTTFTLSHTLTEAQIVQLHRMYQQEWWTHDRRLDDVRTMLRFSDVLFAFCEPATDHLVAFARVLTDRVYKALIFDVIVDAAHRNEGLGKRLMKAICRHPDLASVHHVELYCLPEVMPFYHQYGFTDALGDLRFMRRVPQALHTL